MTQKYTGCLEIQCSSVLKEVFLILIFILLPLAIAQGAERISDPGKIHPRNAELIKQGRMKHWKYFPNVPRLAPETALGLYMANKAVFVLNSYEDLHLVVGGLWAKKIAHVDLNKLVKKDQLLIFY